MSLAPSRPSHRPPPPGPGARIRAVQAPVIPVVGDWIAAHPGTISLGQGVVHYGPPPQVFERLRELAADPGPQIYQAVQGDPMLLELVRRKLRRDNGLDDLSYEVVITAGSNMGFQTAILAIADPGDEIVLLRPCYFNHEMAVRIAGCRPVMVDTDERRQPRIEAIEAAIGPRTRALCTVSPNNPTGAVYPESTLRAINALCAEHGIFHISDEAYEYFVYGARRHFSPAAVAGAEGHTISLYSLSKAYGFSVWRIGYMVIPRSLMEAVMKIQDTGLICAPLLNQRLAAAALEAGPDYCRPFVAELGRTRERALARLRTLGERIVLPDPDGAFYILLGLNARIDDDLALVHRLIAEHGVAVIPGSAFEARDPPSVRISYGALTGARVEEGIDRLVAGLSAILDG